MIKLFVGLGNPGSEYEATRHNAGFWWIDALAAQLGVPLQPDKSYFAQVARFTVDGHARWLLKPQTFMNRSGQSVAGLARFFKIQASEILVVHDELDVIPGVAKMKLGGGHAGHNGLRDIHAQLGSPDYWRLRLGIGHPGVKSEVIHWVLKNPSLEHRMAIDEAVTRSLKAATDFMAGDMETATRLVHTAKPPRPNLPKPSANAGISAKVSPVLPETVG